METIKITADTTKADTTLAELRAWMDSAELPREVINRLHELIYSGLEVDSIVHGATLGARELRVALKFSDSLREFVAAVKAGKIINGNIIEVASHAGESITMRLTQRADPKMA